MGKPQIEENRIKEIHKLRQSGYSIPEIHRFLNVSKSTVLRYCRGVEILPEFHQRWLDRRNASKIISERARLRAESWARDLINNEQTRTLALILGSLYWAEGAKNDFNLTNTDPDLIRTFIELLKKVFRIKNEDIKVSLRIYEDSNKGECVKFWSSVTGVVLDNKITISILKGKKQGKLKYGMCRVRVKKSGLILKTIFAINKQVISLISSRSSMDRASHS